jgi:hypothetical protein
VAIGSPAPSVDARYYNARTISRGVAGPLQRRASNAPAQVAFEGLHEIFRYAIGLRGLGRRGLRHQADRFRERVRVSSCRASLCRIATRSVPAVWLGSRLI